MTGPNTGDEFATGAPDASATVPGEKRTAQDRRDELTHQAIMGDNVQMRHKPTGEVTTYHKSALEGDFLFVPALRDQFPRDQFEEFRERAT
jgi:hypothetical protein